MSPAAGNLFQDLPASAPAEIVNDLWTVPGLRVQRIVSTGQASPPGFWYDQPWSEWVLLVAGAAELELEGEAAPRRLQPGDWLLLPPGRRHRVAWTSPDEPTVWLAVHAAADGRPAVTPPG